MTPLHAVSSPSSILIVLVGMLASGFPLACEEASAPPAAASAATSESGGGSGPDLDDRRGPTNRATVERSPERVRTDELLQRAFDAAVRIPTDPHLKDRSRLQGELIEGFVTLGFADEARARVPEIENWRRSEAYARLAVEAAADPAGAEKARALLGLAERNRPGGLKAWRNNRIDLQIAKALVRLGDDQTAAALDAGFEPADQGRVSATRVESMTRAEVEPLLAQMDEVIAAKSMDLTKNVLEIEAAVYRRFFEDEALRRRLEDRVLEAGEISMLPHQLRLEALFVLSDECLRRGDQRGARRVIDRARAAFDDVQANRVPWSPEYATPLLGEFARRHAEAGDLATANAEIAEAWAVYEDGLLTIADVFRAGALRPVAEAVHATGDREAALAAYLRVLDAGATNPNGRPRAEDLARTLHSMSRVGFQPDDVLERRIVDIESGLGAPW